ncbi:hypothetical protein, partial [Mycobacterium heckeshornense]|uniref:hypothetical protein n=1 Tax=Mycobacterium heckeshornense TaxID=110505 RepID=UPI000A850BA2
CSQSRKEISPLSEGGNFGLAEGTSKTETVPCVERYIAGRSTAPSANPAEKPPSSLPEYKGVCNQVGSLTKPAIID